MANCISVLFFNTPELVESIQTQLNDCPQNNLWFIDNGSTPPMQTNRNVFRIETNQYFTGGWNHAMDFLVPNYDYVWMLNSDFMLITYSMFEKLCAFLNEDKTRAIITPSFNDSAHDIFRPKGTANPREVHWMDWGCPVVSTEAWKTVGPFDDEFKGYGADLDWSIRAKKMGYSFWVDDESYVNHISGHTIQKNPDIVKFTHNVDRMNSILTKKYGKNISELV